MHSYCDAHNLSEALLCATVDVYQKAQEAYGYKYASRRDLVTSADGDPDIAAMAKRLEPSRPVDIRFLKAIAQHFEEQNKGEDYAVIEKSVRRKF